MTSEFAIRPEDRSLNLDDLEPCQLPPVTGEAAVRFRMRQMGYTERPEDPPFLLDWR